MAKRSSGELKTESTEEKRSKYSDSDDSDDDSSVGDDLYSNFIEAFDAKKNECDEVAPTVPQHAKEPTEVPPPPPLEMEILGDRSADSSADEGSILCLSDTEDSTTRKDSCTLLREDVQNLRKNVPDVKEVGKMGAAELKNFDVFEELQKHAEEDERRWRTIAEREAELIGAMGRQSKKKNDPKDTVAGKKVVTGSTHQQMKRIVQDLHLLKNTSMDNSLIGDDDNDVEVISAESIVSIKVVDMVKADGLRELELDERADRPLTWLRDLVLKDYSNVDPSLVSLKFRKDPEVYDFVNVDWKSTPSSAGFLPSPAVNEVMVEVDEEATKIELKIVSSDGKTMKYRVNPGVPLSKQLSGLCSAFKTTVRKLKLMFDGEYVDVNRTPNELELENGYCVECACITPKLR